MSTELQQLNGQNKLALWAERISACRNSGLSVKTWCKENSVCEQTYYKWQKKLFAMPPAWILMAIWQLLLIAMTGVTSANCNSCCALAISRASIALAIDWNPS